MVESKTQLSEAAIVEAALRLTEREGPGALTMRRLGGELGVDPTAVYRYYRDKDDLLLAVADRLYSEVEATVSSGGSWKDRLRQRMLALRTVQLRHPAITSIAFARITGGDAERKAIEFQLRMMREIGLSDADAVLYYRCLVDVVLSLNGLTASVAVLDESLRHKDNTAWSRIYGVLPRSDYPNIAAVAELLTQVNEDEVFMASLDAILDQIERVAART